jgi:electron transport complex protein RnfB
MHTIIESECTGCELCIAPCPVDCISMRSLA